MEVQDIRAGMCLKTEAGWNQTIVDWERFLRLEPGGCFLAELHGDVVGSVTTCRFGSVAWIGMMLVARKHRGKGIGRALFSKALAWLDARKATSIRLDATPLGKPLYEKFGFRSQFELERVGGKIGSINCGVENKRYTVDAIRSHELDDIASLDQAACNTIRKSLLSELIEIDIAGNLIREAGKPVAFTLCREGSGALQIGPSVAISPEAGKISLQHTMSSLEGQEAFIDTPIDHASSRFVKSLGLTPFRTLTRMCYGDNVLENVESLWASSGPEMG